MPAVAHELETVPAARAADVPPPSLATLVWMAPETFTNEG